MRYRIGLQVFEAGQLLGGQVRWFDADGNETGEAPAWFTTACEGMPGESGSIERNASTLDVWCMGENYQCQEGDWIAFFPETGTVMPLPRWMFEKLMVLPAPIEITPQ